MLADRKNMSRLSRMFRDRHGNFAIMTALMLPAGIAAVGVAIDLSNIMAAKSQLQNTVDSAALAAASDMVNTGLSEDGALLLVDNFVRSQAPNSIGNSTSGTVTTNTVAKESVSSDGAKSYLVTVTSEYNVPLTSFMAFFGMPSVSIAVTGQSYASQEMKSNPISMYLVLDRSGSMAENTDTVDPEKPTKQVAYDCSYWSGWTYTRKTCYSTQTNYILKIDALKAAVANLMGQLKTADPNAQYVRTGISTFYSKMDVGTSLEWGTATVLSKTNAMPASGGTNSSTAFQQAVQQLKASTEESEHKDKNGGVPVKYIVFMTDGDNNSTSSDTTTKGHCDDARKEKIEVFAIGFMVNTTRANSLLQYCATTASHYMSANNAAELNENFKSIGAKATAAMTRLTH